MLRRLWKRWIKWKSWRKYTNLGEFSQVLILLGLKKSRAFDSFVMLDSAKERSD